MHGHRVAKSLSCLLCTLLAEFQQDDTLPFCFSSHILNMCHGIFSDTSFHGIFMVYLMAHLLHVCAFCC